MSRQPSSRDLEKLSAYLDGELSASASREMKSRLARDPNLLTALDDLRQTRAILRRIPTRRVPRSFKLTPQMVASKPPMPQAYPVFRFASAVAMILLFFSALPKFGSSMDAAAPMMMEAPVAENFAAAEAEDMMEMPAPAAESAPDEESSPETEKTVADQRSEETTASTPPTERAAQPASSERVWQIILAGFSVLFGLGAFIIRRRTISKWQKASK